jgi:hypothetical protein
MAGWDRSGMTGGESSDPVVRDYLADMPEDEPVLSEPPRMIEQLPANVVRFASANVAARPDAATAGQQVVAPDMQTPPPQVAATALNIQP